MVDGTWQRKYRKKKIYFSPIPKIWETHKYKKFNFQHNRQIKMAWL